MAASCQGDQRAFEQLVLRHETALYRFMNARLGHRADAQDVLQEAFASAWRYRKSYRSKWRFSTWLYRIALRHGHRQRSRQRPSVDLDDAQLSAPSGQDPSNQDVWDHARNHLSAAAFNTVWLHYHEQWQLSEIATCLGRPVSWVKVTLFRARKKLAGVLNPDDYGLRP
ncbi:MAG: RNA polymerase sigma factor [Lysobacterales bacterium]